MKEWSAADLDVQLALFVHAHPPLTLEFKSMKSKKERRLCSEAGVWQVSSLQVDDGQVLTGGTEGQNCQFPPRRCFSVQTEEAETQA